MEVFSFCDVSCYVKEISEPAVEQVKTIRTYYFKTRASRNMMKPIVPTAKRARHGFSIESLIGSEGRRSESPGLVREKIHPGESELGGRVPPLHPTLPSPLRGSFFSENPNELLALRSAWGLVSPPLGAFGHLGQGGFGQAQGLPFNPSLFAGGRDPFQLYPWLLTRHGHCVSYPFPGTSVRIFLIYEIYVHYNDVNTRRLTYF